MQNTSSQAQDRADTLRIARLIYKAHGVTCCYVKSSQVIGKMVKVVLRARSEDLTYYVTRDFGREEV